MTNTRIITNMVDLVNLINREDITIEEVKLVKGIAGEQVSKVTYHYNEEED